LLGIAEGTSGTRWHRGPAISDQGGGGGGGGAGGGLRERLTTGRGRAAAAARPNLLNPGSGQVAAGGGAARGAPDRSPRGVQCLGAPLTGFDSALSFGDGARTDGSAAPAGGLAARPAGGGRRHATDAYLALSAEQTDTVLTLWLQRGKMRHSEVGQGAPLMPFQVPLRLSLLSPLRTHTSRYSSVARLTRAPTRARGSASLCAGLSLTHGGMRPRAAQRPPPPARPTRRALLRDTRSPPSGDRDTVAACGGEKETGPPWPVGAEWSERGLCRAADAAPASRCGGEAARARKKAGTAPTRCGRRPSSGGGGLSGLSKSAR